MKVINKGPSDFLFVDFNWFVPYNCLYYFPCFCMRRFRRTKRRYLLIVWRKPVKRSEYMTDTATFVSVSWERVWSKRERIFGSNIYHLSSGVLIYVLANMQYRLLLSIIICKIFILFFSEVLFMLIKSSTVSFSSLVFSSLIRCNSYWLYFFQNYGSFFVNPLCSVTHIGVKTIIIWNILLLFFVLFYILILGDFFCRYFIYSVFFYWVLEVRKFLLLFQVWQDRCSI